MRKILFITSAFLITVIIASLECQGQVTVKTGKATISGTSVICGRCGTQMKPVDVNKGKGSSTYYYKFRCPKCSTAAVVTSQEAFATKSRERPAKADSAVVTSQEPFATKRTLNPGDVIPLGDGISVQVVPMANECGDQSFFGHWAGQTGAGVDAFMNKSKAHEAAAWIAISATSGMALFAISERGKILNPKEFKRLNKEACAAHDICYVRGDKIVCDENLAKDGGRFMSLGTKLFGGHAYKNAQKEGAESDIYLSKAERSLGQELVLPEGYILKLKKEINSNK